MIDLTHEFYLWYKQSSLKRENMDGKNFLPCITALLTFILGIPASAQEKWQPLVPYKTDTAPVIDGILDDQVWQKAPRETGFKTYSPDYGIDMVENTVVYYAYDRENLYFAFKCYDSQPSKIKASINSRDNIRPDDWICINLDTFNDHQSLYALYCNPLGIQADSKFEGGEEDFSVDVVWYSEGTIDEEGYAVELRIPFKSIRFSHRAPIEMGVIFERKISRRSEAGTYPPLDPKQGSNFLTQTRPLIFRDIKHYTLLEVLPAITYSQKSSLEEGKLTSYPGSGDISLTAKYGITSHLVIDGTVNPDFSQVEADAGQVDFNLRYALFYPEKRPFFLEGLEKFYYGGHYSGDFLGAVVHTRTIVNPLVGVKLNGRIGSKNTVAAVYALDELPDESPEDYAHFGIFRYKHALAKDSFLGGFYTGRERKSGYNRVFGSDGQLRVNLSSVLGYHVFLSQSRADESSGRNDGHALGLHYFSMTRNWIMMFGFQDISENFQTEVGYLTRSGITRFRSGILRMFHLSSGIVRRIDPMFHSMIIREKSSRLYETQNALDLRFLLLRDTYFQVGYRHSSEVFLGEKFWTNIGRLTISSKMTKQLSILFSYRYGKKIRYVLSPYQGSGHDASASLIFLPSEKLHFDLSVTYSDFFRDSDSKKEYDYLILRSGNTYQVNKYLFFRGIVEYNSFRRRLMTDFLASFTYIPGTVIHIGYGSLYEKVRWVDDELKSADSFLESKRGFFFKASFLWRL